MFRRVLLLLLITTSVGADAQQNHRGNEKPSEFKVPVAYRDRLSKATQAVVVSTPDWNNVDGTLVRFEKHNGQWRQIGEKTPVVVGKSGLGWDALVAPVDAASTTKREGDGRSPAGIFAISELGGFDSSRSLTKMSYRQITESTECVDDVKSRSYNKVTDRNAKPSPDWDSSEKMRTIDVYRLMAVVDYNDRKVPGAGSCIFLHIWSGPGKGTAGCTAMDEKNLQILADWLDENKHPVLIQFPASTYQLLRNSWQLP
jgi:D-alanyl-D-alanine dipeptidase